MDTTLTLWLVGALVALLVALLVIVRIARRLERANSASTAAKNPAASRLTKLLEHTGQAKWLAGLNASANGSQGEVAAKTAAKASKAISAGISIAIAMSVGGAVIAAVSKFSDGDIAPAISELHAGQLAGTLVDLRHRDPVVLIVPGSGPTDRDGNSAAGLRTDAYKLLAERLAEEGVASVRIDKRGMYGSAGAGDPNAVTPAAYVADIHAWIDAIKTERGPGSGCIFLLGHSEGALMVSLAAQGREDVCGLILVAGIGRPMGEVIRGQMRANPANAPLLPDAMHALDEIEAGRHVDVSAMHPALQQVFAPAVQDYLISVVNLDPVEALRSSGKPTLIVQGSTDLQVSREDARLLDAAPRTKLQMINGMNHVLKSAPIDRAANLATYEDPTLPLAPKLVRRIEDFVHGND